MQKFSVADNGNPDGTAKDRDGTTPGTYYKALYYNDNIFNLFEFVESQGYTLIADDLSQITKACKGKYNATFTYNTSAIATQSVNDIVEGSDGKFYEAQSDGFSGDDPVGSVSGNWKQVNFDNTPNDTRLFSIAGGTANAITVSLDAILEYKDKSIFMFKASNNNTGSTTININSLGAKNVVIDNVALSGGEILSGNEYFIRYNLTNDNFELISFKTSLNGLLSTSNLLHIQDQKPSGTNGGTFTSGSYQTRDLNTIITDNITGASLLANQITLPAGSYIMMASAPARLVVVHKARIQNVTDAISYVGTSETASAANDFTSRSIVATPVITIASSKVFELQHRCGTTAGGGFGAASIFGDAEVYSDIKIWKVG